jgi:polysaccharide export outer membrane protein
VKNEVFNPEKGAFSVVENSLRGTNQRLSLNKMVPEFDTQIKTRTMSFFPIFRRKSVGSLGTNKSSSTRHVPVPRLGVRPLLLSTSRRRIQRPNVATVTRIWRTMGRPVMWKWMVLCILLLMASSRVLASAQELVGPPSPDPNLSVPSHNADPDPKTPLENAHYVIGFQDELDINVWKEPDFSRVVTVRPDGKISLALVNDLQAAGLTPMELSSAITDRLKEFVSEPRVAVIVLKVNARQIFVVGEVKRAGAYPLAPAMTVLDALSTSGGLTPFAKRKKIYIVRTRDRKQVTIPFDYKQAVAGRHPDKDLPLNPGDKIVVP